MNFLTPRRAFALTAGAALLGGAAWTLAGRPAEAPADPPPGAATLTVITTTAQAEELARTVAASGGIAARDELVVGSDASGVRLAEVKVEIGSIVRRGQLLARGDDAQLQAQLAQQEAQIRQARAELAQAQANQMRAEQVQDTGLYSEEVVQTRRTATEAAAARLELAQAQRRELEVHVARTRVLAPADGVITRRSATVGSVMQPGTELFRLIRDQQLEWLAELPAHALVQVQPGAPARLTLPDGRSVEGRVRLVAPTLDGRTRNGLVHVALPAGAPLKAGGHADGEITVGRARVQTLPEAVVFQRDGQPHVYRVGPDAVARLTRVQTGTRHQGRVEITGGLPEGARVVATGTGFVKDGERVDALSEPPPRAVARIEGAAS